eukprot:144170-Rhodomonas_salina.1
MPRLAKNALYSQRVPVSKGQCVLQAGPGRLLVSASDLRWGQLLAAESSKHGSEVDNLLASHRCRHVLRLG